MLHTAIQCHTVPFSSEAESDLRIRSWAARPIQSSTLEKRLLPLASPKRLSFCRSTWPWCPHSRLVTTTKRYEVLVVMYAIVKIPNFNAKSPMPAFPFPEGYPMAATKTRNPGLMAQQLAAAIKIEKVDTFHAHCQAANKAHKYKTQSKNSTRCTDPFQRLFMWSYCRSTLRQMIEGEGRGVALCPMLPDLWNEINKSEYIITCHLFARLGVLGSIRCHTPLVL